jgi:sugar O-acyltransferase (sialic acid O-acetyltransferase NeuD family)
MYSFALDCVIFGAASAYAGDVAEVLGRLSWKLRGLVDNTGEASVGTGSAPVVGPDEIPDDWLKWAVVIPVATPGHRAAAVEHAGSLGFKLFPPVVDPTSVMAASATLSAGCIVNAGVVIAANAQLQRFASVSRNASVGHDAILEGYVFVGPGATLCGGSRIGRGAFIGAGAVVLPEVVIGANAVVGAGAVANKDVPEGTVAAGNPAQIVDEPRVGYRGLTVQPEEPNGGGG